MLYGSCSAGCRLILFMTGHEASKSLDSLLLEGGIA